jgi:hypothetical protein
MDKRGVSWDLAVIAEVEHPSWENLSAGIAEYLSLQIVDESSIDHRDRLNA